jgi:hypothetical protein
MNSEHTPSSPQHSVPDSGQSAGEHPPIEAAAKQPTPRALWAHSVVPALTLLALEFSKSEPSPVVAIILSIGNGSHRPGAG